MGILNEEEKESVWCGEVIDDEFRLWSNPELYMNPGMPLLLCYENRDTVY
jgi:hypothetical protein